MAKKIDDKGKDTDDRDHEDEERDDADDEPEDDATGDEQDAADEPSDEDDEATDEDADDDDADDDDADGDDADDEEAEEPSDVAAAPARPAPREERARRKRTDDAEHGHAAPLIPDRDEDPSWWVPHATMGVLVLLGVLGFFGLFNGPGRAVLGKLGMLPPTLGATTEPVAATPPPTSKTAAPVRPAMSAMPRPPRPEGEFGAKHLLVMYKGGRKAPPNVTRTKEEAKARAEGALKKAKTGTKFDDLVKEYTDEPGGAARGGDLGTFNKGSMVPPFQAGLEATKVGEISNVVETDFGFHVILRTK